MLSGQRSSNFSIQSALGNTPFRRDPISFIRPISFISFHSHFPNFPRPSNREECSLRFETPDNTSNEQRGVLGSAFLEEEYVLRCLSARAITEAA
jgi:hypothetical protein